VSLDFGNTHNYGPETNLDNEGHNGSLSGTARLWLQRQLDALKQAGINSVFYVSPDTAHEFLSWRHSPHELAPLLFKE
jgi:hypothetical protein